jgi:hypothetical protein
MKDPCTECSQADWEQLTTCTYCGKSVCYDCRDEHERECEDNDEEE